MSDLDDIIKLLEEDAEYDIVKYIRSNRNTITKNGFYSWFDKLHRRILYTGDAISGRTSLLIREHSNNIQKTYYKDAVQIYLREPI